MKISYIITTFNRHELLERAVGYVARERCEDSELIVVDDHSQTPVIMPDLAYVAFPNAQLLIRNSTNLGVIGARNVGIAAAKGTFVIFLDDDDESLPNRTTDLLSTIQGSAFDFVAGRALMQTGAQEKRVPLQAGFLFTLNQLLLNPPHIDAIIWRRTMFAGSSGLDNRVPYLGEHISMVVCLLHGGLGYLSESVVARFRYITSGLTKEAQQLNRLKTHLIQMYQVLLDESETPTHRQLFDRILQMLRNETINDFDGYLERISPILRRYR